MHAIVAVAFFISGQVAVSGQLPERLLSPLDSRRAETSEVEWTFEYLKGFDAGLVERHITRSVGDVVWEINLGDENGYHRTASGGGPVVARDDGSAQVRGIPKERLAGPYHSLLHNGHIWHLEHQRREPPEVGVAMPEGQAKSYRPLDFRLAGIGPWWNNHDASVLGLRENTLVGFEDATYSVSSQGNVVTIIADFAGKRIEWNLDEARGGHPISAQHYCGDRLVGSAYTELSRVGDRWFPSSIRFYEFDETEPSMVITVQRATFDEAWHVQEITPEDIGVLFGTLLHGPTGYRVWDGTELISYQEYEELIYIDGLRPDPHIVQKMARISGMTVEEYLARMDRTMEQWRARYLEEHGEAPWLAKKGDERDPWDLYVADFVKKRKLDEPRIKKANDLLKAAKKLRDYRERKNRSEIAKAKRADDMVKLAHYEQMSERIFQKVLVHKLEKLDPDVGTVDSNKVAQEDRPPRDEGCRPR